MTVLRQNCAAPLTVGGGQFDVGYAGFLRDREEILTILAVEVTAKLQYLHSTV